MLNQRHVDVDSTSQIRRVPSGSAPKQAGSNSADLPLKTHHTHNKHFPLVSHKHKPSSLNLSTYRVCYPFISFDGVTYEVCLADGKHVSNMGLYLFGFVFYIIQCAVSWPMSTSWKNNIKQ